MITQRNAEQLTQMLSQILIPLGYCQTSSEFFPESFGNGGAEYEKSGEFKFSYTLDRGELSLRVQPLTGLASFKSYEFTDILRSLEAAGVAVHKRANKTDEELDEYLLRNIRLIIELKSRLKFPLLGEDVRLNK